MTLKEGVEASMLGQIVSDVCKELQRTRRTFLAENSKAGKAYRTELIVRPLLYHSPD